MNKKCPEYPRKTIIEEDFIVAKEAKIKPQQQKDYEQVKDMLRRGHPLYNRCCESMIIQNNHLILNGFRLSQTMTVPVLHIA
ncbi:MAG: hypothetical protein P8179_22475 [Candidatus Thiodiazotropha sp.]